MKVFINAFDLIGAKPASSSGPVVEFQQRSVHVSAVEHLGKRLGVDASTLLALMGIPERTRARRRHEGFFKAAEADRLLRIARVFAEAIRVFGSEEKAALWLNTPSPLFQDSAPLTWLDSDGGAYAVREEIVRIDFGDFA
jgi:putative toxin-antitoxin system antitoxin component (TIGR02293 family)